MRGYERNMLTGSVVGAVFVLTLDRLTGTPWANIFYTVGICMMVNGTALLALRLVISDKKYPDDNK